jgi:hypothetical protein
LIFIYEIKVLIVNYDFQEEVLRLRKANRDVREMSSDSAMGSMSSSQSLVQENNRVFIVLAVFAVLFGILLGKFLL